MAEITVQNLPSAGVATDDATNIDYTAASATGDSADLKTQAGHFLRVINGAGAPVTVTITSQQDCQLNDTTPADIAVSVTNGKTFDVKLVPLSMQGLSDLDWRVRWAYSAVTSVSIAVLKA